MRTTRRDHDAEVPNTMATTSCMKSSLPVAMRTAASYSQTRDAPAALRRLVAASVLQLDRRAAGPPGARRAVGAARARPDRDHVVAEHGQGALGRAGDDR